MHVVISKFARYFCKISFNGIKNLLRKINEVHLIDAYHHMRDLQQCSNIGMPAGLFDDTVARIYQDYCSIRGRSAGDHVSCILDMTGGIGNDEFSFRSCKVAVSHINGYSLLPLSPQAIGQQSQVNFFPSPANTGPLNGLHLVFKNGLTVEQQASDQGTFPVIDTPRGSKPEKLHIQVSDLFAG